MRQLRRSTQWYLLGLTIAGSLSSVLLLVPALPMLPAQLGLLVLIGLVYLIVDHAAIAFPVAPPETHAVLSLIEAPTLLALLLVGPLGLLPVAGATVLVTRGLQRFPWADTLVVLQNRLLAYNAAAALLLVVAPPDVGPTTPRDLLLLALLVLTYWTTATLLNLLHLGVVNHQPLPVNLQRSLADGDWIALIPATMGIIAARLARRDPWLIVLLLAPVGLAYLALRAIARSAAQHEELRVLRDVRRLMTLFLANISHDLRTPLSNLRGFVHRLRKPRLGTLTAAQLETLDAIDRNADHLLRLVNDLLDLTRAERGSLAVAPAPTDLAPLLGACLRDAQLLLDTQPQAGRVQLLLDLPPTLPPVLIDPTRIRQVVLNLLTNALTFTDAGTIRLSVVAGAPVTVTVADTGIGMSPAQQATLFEPFRPILADGRPHGSGLGLALARQLVEAHGGRIWLDSAPGAGTTVGFTLPCAPDAAPNGTEG